MFAVQADGHEVTTVEGLDRSGEAGLALQVGDARLARLPMWVLHSGLPTTVTALLAENPGELDRTRIREALAGNLCRCSATNRLSTRLNSPSHGGSKRGDTWPSISPPRSSGHLSSARRTCASSPAAAATSGTSTAPASCTLASSGPALRTPGSRLSTRPRLRRCRAYWRSSPVRTFRAVRDRWTSACLESPGWPRPSTTRCPLTALATSAIPSRSSWAPAVTWLRTRPISSGWSPVAAGHVGSRGGRDGAPLLHDVVPQNRMFTHITSSGDVDEAFARALTRRSGSAFPASLGAGADRDPWWRRIVRRSLGTPLRTRLRVSRRTQ